MMNVSLAQAALAIKTIGSTNTVILRGEPGIGKSSILKMLATSMPDYRTSYIDCANLDLGDVAMPVIDRDRMVTNYAPNARFGVGTGITAPVIVMLDELGKTSKSVLNMLLPVILEHRIGDVPLPTGSIVFATTNLDTDGVGDNIPAHAYNRMTEMVVRKANPKEMMQWGTDNGWSAEVLAFIRQQPDVLDSYVDLKAGDKNPYIFNPLTGNTRSFISPRSLEKASNIINARSVLGEAMLPALAGTIGEAGARQMEALVSLADQLPSYEGIVANPDTAKIPDSVGALFILAFMLAGRVSTGDCDEVMTYIKRMSGESFEAAALAVTSIASNANKAGWAARNRKFTELCAAYGKYF